MTTSLDRFVKAFNHDGPAPGLDLHGRELVLREDLSYRGHAVGWFELRGCQQTGGGSNPRYLLCDCVQQNGMPVPGAAITCPILDTVCANRLRLVADGLIPRRLRALKWKHWLLPNSARVLALLQEMNQGRFVGSPSATEIQLADIAFFLRSGRGLYRLVNSFVKRGWVTRTPGDRNRINLVPAAIPRIPR